MSPATSPRPGRRSALMNQKQSVTRLRSPGCGPPVRSSSAAPTWSSSRSAGWASIRTTARRRNPYQRRLGRVPGGSSSGAAVAQADGMAVMSLGSDTRGSIRGPAALCGVTGWKPTARRVPREGAFPLSFTLDSVGSDRQFGRVLRRVRRDPRRRARKAVAAAASEGPAAPSASLLGARRAGQGRRGRFRRFAQDPFKERSNARGAAGAAVRPAGRLFQGRRLRRGGGLSHSSRARGPHRRVRPARGQAHPHRPGISARRTIFSSATCGPNSCESSRRSRRVSTRS